MRHEFVVVGLGGDPRTHDGAVAQDGDPVGDAEDLRQPVRHVEHGDAVVAQPPDQAKQRVDLDIGQRRGRLVEGDDPHVGDQCTHDLDELALGR